MKRSRLRPISKAPHRLAKRFLPGPNLKAVKKRSGGRCEVVFTLHLKGGDWFRIHPESNLKSVNWCRCPKAAMPIPHHLLKRSQGGGHEPSNLLDACSECHRWIEDHSTAAAQTGLHIPWEGFTP